MSDFGTTITISKKDKSNFTESEISEIEVKMTEYIRENDLTVLASEELYTVNITKMNDPHEELFIQLSEHYYSGDEIEDQESFEFVEEIELVDTEGIIEHLKGVFPNLDYKAEVTEW